MVVLGDASPLRYLLLIGEADLLSGLYGRIVMPDVVAGELNRPRTPQLVISAQTVVNELGGRRQPGFSYKLLRAAFAVCLCR